MKIGRRDFLKTAGVLGAGAVISLYTFDIRRVFAEVTEGKRHVIWLQGAGDTGCTVSLLQGVNPDLVDVIRNFRLSVDFQPTLMIPAGDEALKSLEDAANGITPLDMLIVEGAVPKGNYCTVGEIAGMPVPFEDWVKVLGERAKHVVAVGTCAAFGGIPAANPNPTRCKSVEEVLNGKTVINLPGCPPHPDWMTLALAAVLSGLRVKLDGDGRPIDIYHEGDEAKPHAKCLLKKYHDEEKFATIFGQEPLLCLYKLGCKGKEGDVFADCTVRLWNNGVNVCMYAGAPCIGCVSPAFPDGLSPFYKVPERKMVEALAVTK